MNEKQDLVCVFKGQAFEAEVVRARLEYTYQILFFIHSNWCLTIVKWQS